MKKNIWVYPLLILSVLLMLTMSCKKKESDGTDDNKKSTVPVLTTSEVTEITQTTAKCGGVITSDMGYPVIARGVCWSNKKTPSVSDYRSYDSIGLGAYKSSVHGLAVNVDYYVRAYATNKTGTGYGNIISFKTLEPAPGTLIDQDGFIFDSVKIGNQVWMKQNLKAAHYRNGDSIPNITINAGWAKLTSGALCNFNNDVNNSIEYGKIYNWIAVTDIRNICPAGWHVPSDAEWWVLVDYLGGDKVAGGKMKESSVNYWKGPNTGATNESGFTLLPGGYRNLDGIYISLGFGAGLWTSTSAQNPNVWYRYVFYDDAGVSRSYQNKGLGFSVRCIKD